MILEKKGEYEDSGFEFLRNASSRELFYLHSGVTIGGARTFIVQLRTMDDDAFSDYNSNGENEIISWFNLIFKDKLLYESIKNETSRSAIINVANNRLCDLIYLKLKKYGVNISKANIISAEEYVQTRLSKGDSLAAIKNNLLASGWSSKVLELMFESNSFFYNIFTSINELSTVLNAQIKFDYLKKNIINAIADGLSIEEILNHLKNQGWSKETIEYIFLNIYKPKTNLIKVSWFITKEIGDNNKELLSVKTALSKSGLSDYQIDYLIHKIREETNELDELLNIVVNFDEEEKNRLSVFFRKNGWEESFINQAFKNRDAKNFLNYVSKSLNVESNILQFNSDIFENNILKLKNTNSSNVFWTEINKDYKKINLNDFKNDNNELHAEINYIYFYSKLDIDVLLTSAKQGILKSIFPGQGISFYYSNPIKPLLCSINKDKFLISSRIIKKACVSCNNYFPITKMNKLEIWDTTRTHKVTKYVCRQHEKLVNTLIEETRIVQ